MKVEFKEEVILNIDLFNRIIASIKENHIISDEVKKVIENDWGVKLGVFFQYEEVLEDDSVETYFIEYVVVHSKSDGEIPYVSYVSNLKIFDNFGEYQEQRLLKTKQE